MTEPMPRPASAFDEAFLTGIEGVTEIVLVRHGEQTTRNMRDQPSGGWVDPPLSERGVNQARLVGERFSTDRVDVVYASPLQRAYDTGFQIARHHRLEPVVMQDLREVEVFRDVPQERSVEEFVGRDLLAGVRERMVHERKWDVYPHSESSFGFRKRTVNAIEAIIAVNQGKRVVVACHGGVINAYIGHIIGVEADMFFRPAHTAVNVVYAGINGIRALQSLNDVRHLLHVENTLSY